MSATVFGIILFAALCHATWNAIVKGAPDKFMAAMLVAAVAAVIAAVALPFLPQPASASWPYLAASVVIHFAYYALVAAAYRSADMSQAYPLMRGSAPLLVAVAGAVWLGENLPLPAWIGIGLISAGVIGTAFGARGRGNGRGLAFALANAVVIAAYTISDGVGVRLSGAPPGYIMWGFLLTGIPLVGLQLTTRAGGFVRYAAGNFQLGIVGGIATLTSYGLALWAMTVAPVAVVAALRETAILFAVAIAALVLKERVGPARIAAVGIIAIGAVVLRLA